jgi:hypothetical protein
MRFLIGIDDTDNLESRGTGHRARQLAQQLEAQALAAVHSITRHQLLVDPRIPYTSHNSSACLMLEAGPMPVETLINFCREFLINDSAPGSDVGLCLAEWSKVNEHIQSFGARAKRDVLTKVESERLAESNGIRLEGLTGTGGGIIGALAAVGLRAGGDDGRVLWMRGLRELQGSYSAELLRQSVNIDSVESLSGEAISPSAQIEIGDWPRPILRAGKITLLVEEMADHDHHYWRTADKNLVKHLTG